MTPTRNSLKLLREARAVAAHEVYTPAAGHRAPHISPPRNLTRALHPRGHSRCKEHHWEPTWPPQTPSPYAQVTTPSGHVTTVRLFFKSSRDAGGRTAHRNAMRAEIITRLMSEQVKKGGAKP